MIVNWVDLEKQSEDIDKQIKQLEGKQQDILRLDPEYASYLDECDLQEVEPISIRLFHKYSQELDEISRQVPLGDNERFDRWWNRNVNRIRELERLLLA